MPVWPYSGKEVSEEEVRRAIKNVGAACFQCDIGDHSEDCPIMGLLSGLAAMLKEARQASA